MKRFHLLLLLTMFAFTTQLATAQQNINYYTLEPTQRHMISLHAGFEHGAVLGIGYGYQVKSTMPIILSLDFSVPAGDNAFDDLKTKIGGQVNVISAGHFQTAVKAYGIFRRYENDMVRMLNFGSEFSATAGYYTSKWHAAAEFGFDKAVVTHIRHSDVMHEYNPSVQNGWYLPTGGNFFYGIQGGYAFATNDLYARLGRTVEQDFKTTSILPWYFEMGWNVKFGR